MTMDYNDYDFEEMGYSNYDSEEESVGYGRTYGMYAGSYAQDVEGYSDEAINDAFDGDPDAYWNID